LRSDRRDRKQQRRRKKRCEDAFRSMHNPRRLPTADVRAKACSVAELRLDGFAHGNLFLILAATAAMRPVIGVRL
jgi:hypothetical protein